MVTLDQFLIWSPTRKVGQILEAQAHLEPQRCQAGRGLKICRNLICRVWKALTTTHFKRHSRA